LCQSSSSALATLTDTTVKIVFTLHFTVIQHTPGAPGAFVCTT